MGQGSNQTLLTFSQNCWSRTFGFQKACSAAWTVKQAPPGMSLSMKSSGSLLQLNLNFTHFSWYLYLCFTRVLRDSPRCVMLLEVGKLPLLMLVLFETCDNYAKNVALISVFSVCWPVIRLSLSLSPMTKGSVIIGWCTDLQLSC